MRFANNYDLNRNIVEFRVYMKREVNFEPDRILIET